MTAVSESLSIVLPLRAELWSGSPTKTRLPKPAVTLEWSRSAALDCVDFDGGRLETAFGEEQERVLPGSAAARGPVKPNRFRAARVQFHASGSFGSL